MSSRPPAHTFPVLFLAALGIAHLPAQDSLQLIDTRFVSGVKMELAGDAYVLHFPHGDVKVPKASVKMATLAGVTDQNLSPDEKTRLDKGEVRFEGRWMPLAERDRLLDKRRSEREARIQEALAHREWTNRYTLKTENFAFEFTIDPEVMKGFGDLMEVYYKNFTKEWGITRPSKLGKLKVCFYHDEDYFHQVSGAPPGVIGYFRFVEPMELNFYFDRLDRDMTIDVMFHETNHYLTTLIDPKFRYPIWVNESLAEYYGASAWDPTTKKMTIGGIQEGRLAAIQSAIKLDEWQGLEALIRLKHGEFNATHYAWGWSFVHWLLQNKATEKKFKDFYLALARDKGIKREPVPPLMKEVPADEVIRVLLKHLDAKSLDELQKGWHEYVKSLKPSSGRGYFEAGQMALMYDMPIKAQRYLRTAIDMDYKAPQVYATLGQALWRKDQDGEAVKMYEQAVALDPLNAAFYLGLARAHRGGSGKSPDVTRLQWLALEIARATNDPNEYAILVDLGPDFTKPDPSLAAPGVGK